MNPKEFETLHLHSDTIPWVDFGGGTSVRILHARPSENFVVTQILAQPGSESQLHRHLGPVFGWTVEGHWGHDRNYEYRPGTYIFETPGVLHKFLGGDEVINAVFTSFGVMEYVDEASLEVTAQLDPAAVVQHYMQKCEEMNLARPNILS